MKTMNNELMQSPSVYQITQRLADLIQNNSRSELEACLIMTFKNKRSKQVHIQRHINNLLLSFDSSDIQDALNIMGLLVTLQRNIKRVG